MQSVVVDKGSSVQLLLRVMDAAMVGSRYGLLVRIEASDSDGGHCFTALLPKDWRPGDSSADPFISTLILLENGVGLGPAHAAHNIIREQGCGLFSHWHDSLYFSTSDNTDPRCNDREYHVFSPPLHHVAVQRAIGVLNSLPQSFSPADAYVAIEKCLAALYPEAKIGEDQKSFWRETHFLEAYRRMCGENYRSLERKFAVYNVLRTLHEVEGDMAECGVYNGATAYFMALANEEAGRNRNIFLFDSFQGLSPPIAEDGSYWRAGDLACPEKVPQRNLSGFRNINFLQGWIPTRFQEVADRTFCFIHVDVDLYEPTRKSLEFFFPRLISRGILVCDDYGFESCPGARRAMDEFFADKPDQIVHLPTGQGLVIKA
jgi:O-methyltransferase